MSPVPAVATTAPPPRFLDRLRTALLIRGLPPEVTEAWVGWVRTFIRFHQLRHPESRGEAEVGAFLTHLAVGRGAALPQQAQARLARRFLERAFPHRERGVMPVFYRPPAGEAGAEAPPRCSTGCGRCCD